ncbi:MAG: hypothetical protein AABW50_00835 [Nanoarchaeota archaeon]
MDESIENINKNSYNPKWYEWTIPFLGTLLYAKRNKSNNNVKTASRVATLYLTSMIETTGIIISLSKIGLLEKLLK